MDTGYYDKTIGGWFPNEEETKTISGYVTITYKFEREVPVNWDNEEIEQDIKDYLEDYQEELVDIDIDI